MKHYRSYEKGRQKFLSRGEYAVKEYVPTGSTTSPNLPRLDIQLLTVVNGRKYEGTDMDWPREDPDVYVLLPENRGVSQYIDDALILKVGHG